MELESSRRLVVKWHKRFSDGEFNVNNSLWAGHPLRTECDIAWVRNIVKTYRRKTRSGNKWYHWNVCLSDHNPDPSRYKLFVMAALATLRWAEKSSILSALLDRFQLQCNAFLRRITVTMDETWLFYTNLNPINNEWKHLTSSSRWYNDGCWFECFEHMSYAPDCTTPMAVAVFVTPKVWFTWKKKTKPRTLV